MRQLRKIKNPRLIQVEHCQCDLSPSLKVKTAIVQLWSNGDIIINCPHKMFCTKQKGRCYFERLSNPKHERTANIPSEGVN